MMYVCMYVCMYKYVYVCTVRMHTYMCIYVCINVCMLTLSYHTLPGSRYMYCTSTFGTRVCILWQVAAGEVCAHLFFPMYLRYTSSPFTFGMHTSMQIFTRFFFFCILPFVPHWQKVTNLRAINFWTPSVLSQLS